MENTELAQTVDALFKDIFEELELSYKHAQNYELSEALFYIDSALFKEQKLVNLIVDSDMCECHKKAMIPNFEEMIKSGHVLRKGIIEELETGKFKPEGQ